jgi:prophage tail gpP-like protein
VSDDVVLKINGQNYAKWTEVRISRGLKECASAFDIAVTERWAGRGSTPWQIRPFDSCEIQIGGETVLTGYVDHYGPSFDAKSHTVRIAGRSKTCDLVDCMPDFPPGQFLGNKIDAIAKAVAGQFGIDVVVECDVGDAFGDVMLERTETAFSFLEKLARLRSIILTDDVEGRLVLTQASDDTAAGSLIEGENILSASAKLSGNERFQKYVVLAQLPVPVDGESEERPDVVGEWPDPNVPRFRRFAEMAEDPLDDAPAQARARWRAKHNAAISTEATVTVQGFRQVDGGDLWRINRTISVKSPRLGIDQRMLIGKITYTIDEHGSRTDLLVAPPAAFTPEPDPKGVNNSDKLFQGVNRI